MSHSAWPDFSDSLSLYPLYRCLGPEATFLSSNEHIYAMIAGHTSCVFPPCCQEVLQ